jgi:hypothetical protein
MIQEQPQETPIDQWQALLQEQKQKLQACQEERYLKSCMPCRELLECTLRQSYIKAVYESMSKGSSGGFEF